MMLYRLKLAIVTGTAILLVAMAAGAAVLVDRGKRAALSGAQSSLERSAQGVENALNRQLLQVHGALASLPTLFAAAKALPDTTIVAAELLRGLNFQTLAYRNLLLARLDGTILAAARSIGLQRTLPFDVGSLSREPTALIGPIRNSATGDWSLYVARTAPVWDGIASVAEVPLPTLMSLLAETSIDPRATIALERPNGRLIAALPHDELRTGQVSGSALGIRTPDGKAFMVDPSNGGDSSIAVVRASLYGDVRVVLSANRAAMLADWRRDRDATLAAMAIGALLLVAFATALLIALRQRERADAERARSASVLLNAVEAMSDGFVMWDDKDRLVTCNQPYRDLFTRIAPLMVPGVPFQDIVREGAKLGQYPEAGDNIEAFTAEMIAWHRKGHGSVERRLPDGRWILVKERRTADGGIVGIRTDITSLKTMLADLAEATARANDAVAEAQRQNAVLAERESRIRFLAHHDDLTRLPNRVLFRDHIEAALRVAADQDMRIALLYLDLDRFKDVNDTLGHPVGDALLCAAAARLSACVNDAELIARLGGDEFAVISLAPAQPHEAETIGARIIRKLSEPYSILGHTIAISVSIGIAVADSTNGPDADALLKQADLALYQAKANGRGTLCLFEPGMDEHLRSRIDMEADLRHAAARQQFELLYQPVYELDSERLGGFEALLRWKHPQRGIISPATFIPIAEDTRLIVEIGVWVIRRACADGALLPAPLRVAINISPVQLAFGDIVTTVREALHDTHFDPERLELEITETALFVNDQRNLDTLRRLKDLGVRIVLDDFGTGYSSLSHLRLFPLDKIKIDRSFVREMTMRADSAAIVDAIASLARRLGMTTTAEGVETHDQWEVVRHAGCTEAQGYLFGAPQPIASALVTAASPRQIALVAAIEG